MYSLLSLGSSSVTVVIGFSFVSMSLRNWLIALNACSRSGLFVRRLKLVDYCRAGLADDLVLGIRASRTADCADNRALVDQWNAAARRNNSIEREQIVEMHQIDAVLKYLVGRRKVAAARALCSAI